MCIRVHLKTYLVCLTSVQDEVFVMEVCCAACREDCIFLNSHTAIKI